MTEEPAHAEERRGPINQEVYGTFVWVPQEVNESADGGSARLGVSGGIRCSEPSGSLVGTETAWHGVFTPPSLKEESLRMLERGDTEMGLRRRSRAMSAITRQWADAWRASTAAAVYPKQTLTRGALCAPKTPRGQHARPEEQQYSRPGLGNRARPTSN